MSRATARRVVAIALASASVMGAAACGGDDSDSGSGGNASSRSRQGSAQDPKVAACLKKQGVDIPQGRQGAPPQGTPPQGTPPASGQPPNGGAPGGGQGFGGNSKQAKQLRKAMQKCGVKLPQRPQGGAPPQGTPQQ